ncbi:unnamed protein product [Blepharisma stoltei]|uniref:Vacuolar fusion protein MON1 homolog n=1 Tax=Blepharisma stoltei TaxID=1481888 RepID=A0AAU9J9M1_9CILI|nr:unnamed protein product [Blepharisma stoltei]
METPLFLRKKKLFFVFTSAAKPVWTRYGSETDLSTFIGSLAAILYKFQNYYTGIQDSLRYLRTADMYVVFLCTEALFYVCISKGKDSLESLYNQLRMLHTKVISTLTDNITTMLISRPSYDARNLMGGTHSALDYLIRTTAVSPSMLDAFMPVPMLAQHRSQIQLSFKSHLDDDLLYGFIMTSTSIIYRYCRKGENIHHIDTSLLFNMLASHSSLRSTMSWTPICLPNFSDKGFVYAYITFLQDSQVGLALLSDNSAAFKNLKACGDAIETEIRGLLPIIEESVKSIPYSVSICGIKEFKHFIYMTKAVDQYTMSGFTPSTRDFLPEMPIDIYKRTLRRYFAAYKLSNIPEFFKGNYTKIDTYKNEQIVALRTNEYVLFASLSSMLPAAAVVQLTTQLLRWLKSQEQDFFIMR